MKTCTLLIRKRPVWKRLAVQDVADQNLISRVSPNEENWASLAIMWSPEDHETIGKLRCGFEKVALLFHIKLQKPATYSL